MSERMPNQPRDLTADKEAFLAAIDPISIQEIPTVFDAEVLEKLPASLDETKLFILGEMHGVRENADIIYTLFKKIRLSTTSS
jgi:ssDNA-specific exonuclease RecJ